MPPWTMLIHSTIAVCHKMTIAQLIKIRHIAPLGKLLIDQNPAMEHALKRIVLQTIQTIAYVTSLTTVTMNLGTCVEISACGKGTLVTVVTSKLISTVLTTAVCQKMNIALWINVTVMEMPKRLCAKMVLPGAPTKHVAIGLVCVAWFVFIAQCCRRIL